ncbi:MAG: hypothetical protein M1839_001117 [Geoglossum umbratile]|nr:MAG: hypothetical protein M1839_001117 [Geoglossum umbratile]
MEGKTPPPTSPTKGPEQQRSQVPAYFAPPTATTTATTYATTTATISFPDLERAPGQPAGALRRRASSFQDSMARVGTAISTAHVQDFERRRPAGEAEPEQSSDDDDDDDDDVNGGGMGGMGEMGEMEEMEGVGEGWRVARERGGKAVGGDDKLL